ncbi:MAG TPA: CHAT domain-containing protein [Pyrinomonadaceae bacterium]|nr:CHAT domain-containing protein [Pyrinomonadaceae bacterium]
MQTQFARIKRIAAFSRTVAALKIQVIASACCLILLCASTPAHAQEQGEAAFDEAASKHKRELRDLLQTRGLSLSSGLRIATSKSIAARLKEGFPEGTALLFYDYDEPTLRVWVVGAEGIRAFQSLSVTHVQLKTAVTDFRNSLGVDSPQRGGSLRAPLNRRRVRVTSNVTPFDRAELKLTGVLMPPEIASASASAKHLIVVPVLEISAVPFALLRPFPQGASGQFLIERMSVSVAPSLFDIGQQMVRKGTRMEQEGISQTWNPQFQRPLVVGNPLPLSDSFWEFRPLPGAQSEAVEVAKRLGVKDVLIGGNATKQSLAAKVEDADFLYLATHGIASSEKPLTESFLVLGAEKTDAGRWTAKEIQDAMLNARLAVLSACSTGLGQHHAAGTIGLARAFQKSGVPRVVMSLWDVEDTATSELMLLFVENLKSRIPAEALRQAMLEYRKRHPKAHPSLWAAFTFFGTPR